MAKYSKFIVAVLGAVLTGLDQFLGLSVGIGAEEIVQFAIPILTALGVWGVANK